MNGAEAVEVGAAAHLGGRAAVDGRDLFERRAPALAAGTGLAVELIPRTELVLADDALADVDVPVRRQVACLAAAEKSRAAPGQLEHAQHQAAAATERLIRYRMAASP